MFDNDILQCICVDWGSTDIFFNKKKVPNAFVITLISQKFQFMQVKNVNLNSKAFSTFLINKNYLCYPYDVT